MDAQVCIILRLPASVTYMVSLDSKLYFAGSTPTLKIGIGSFKVDKWLVTPSPKNLIVQCCGSDFILDKAAFQDKLCLQGTEHCRIFWDKRGYRNAVSEKPYYN